MFVFDMFWCDSFGSRAKPKKKVGTAGGHEALRGGHSGLGWRRDGDGGGHNEYQRQMLGWLLLVPTGMPRSLE